MRSHGTLVVAICLSGLGVVASAGCGNSVPVVPSYENDIKPIMSAHCIRCHGAGGTKNMDPDIPVIKGAMNLTPALGDFTTEDGLKVYTVPSGVPNDTRTLLQYDVDTLPMPPPPSSALPSYDYDTLITWASHPR